MSVLNSRKRTSWQSVRFRPGLNESKKDTGDIFLSKNHLSFIFIYFPNKIKINQG